MSASWPPLLRAPPFPWADAAVSHPSGENDSPSDIAALFALVREARVGGRFWAESANLTQPATIVLRPGDSSDHTVCQEAVAATGDGAGLWISTSAERASDAGEGPWHGDVDPWSVLPGAGGLLAHGDDEWVALARIAGVPVRLLSPGRFGAPGDGDAALDDRVALALLAVRWCDPFTGGESTFAQTVELLGVWRRMLDINHTIAAACGMAWWKRQEIRRFLWHPGRPLRIVRRTDKALAIAGKTDSAVAIWPSRISPGLISAAAAKSVPLVRVEDGFVRSAGLGVDLVPPSSVVVDATGIHFDPSRASDLETLLETAAMPQSLLDRAMRLRATIVAAGISKYAAEPGGGVASVPARAPGRRLVLVPGQVGDDMSVKAGGGGIGPNLELLRRARDLEPDAEIWFRPHPDVDAGHRNGAVPDSEILRYANRIARGGGMAPLLDAVDAVHVLTSLTGFEALMRGREVICHGIPFYAGWGLTQDLAGVPARRTRRLTLDALVAGVLILYPRYLDPVTGLPCPPEVLVGRMADARATSRLDWIAPLRRWQGRFMRAFR